VHEWYENNEEKKNVKKLFHKHPSLIKLIVDELIRKRKVTSEMKTIDILLYC